MGTPGPDLSRLSISQIARLTGFDRKTVMRALEDLEAHVPGPRGAKLYPSKLALEKLYLGHVRLSVSEQQARLAKERADMQALRNAELRGELVPASALDQVVVTLATIVSSRLRRIPGEIGAKIARERKRPACERLLRDAIEEALRELVARADQATPEAAAEEPRSASGAR